MKRYILGKYFRKIDICEVYGALLVSENWQNYKNMYWTRFPSTSTFLDWASSYWLLLVYSATKKKNGNIYMFTQQPREQQSVLRYSHIWI